MKRLYNFLCLLALLLLVSMGAKADKERVFKAITASDGLADNSAQTIKCTKTGRMTITTIGNINFYDGARFSQIDVNQEEKYPLPNYQGHYHLYFDHYHHLWLKGSHDVVCVNLSTERYISNMDSLFATFDMHEPVLDMFIDMDGEVWLMGQGYIRSNKYGYKVPVDSKLNLQDLEVYNQEQLMLFYEDGTMVCYDVKTGKERYRNRPYDEKTAKLYFRSVVQLPTDDGFFQIRNGEVGAILLYYDLKSRRWTEKMRSEYHLNNLAIHDNELFIPSEWGYFTLDLNTGETHHQKVLTLRNGTKLETDINVIEFDRQGGMWLGTEKRGLLYGRRLTDTFTVLDWNNPLSLKYWDMMKHLDGISRFQGRKANVKYEDSRGWTWVGTPAGLLLIKPNAPERAFTRKDGLLNNVVHTIIEDRHKNIWIGTSYGISCLTVAGDSVKKVFSFNQDNNVPNETFIDGKAIRLADGTIVMQALDHVVTFQPDNFQQLFNRKPYVMYPKLTRMLVNGIDVEAGQEINGDVILDKAITRVREINLNYDQNTVTLTFSALNYARPLLTCYRVRIKELGNQWHEYSYFDGRGLVDNHGLLHLPLVGLQPGSYHVELLASVVEDQFVGEPFVWTINVNEPWWRGSFAYWTLGLLLAALLIYNFYLFNRNSRMKERRLSDEDEVIKRVKLFVDRCDEFSTVVLAPSQEERSGAGPDMRNEMSSEFIQVMLRLLPFVHERGERKMTMREMSDVAGISVQELYSLMSSNFYKSPRTLVRTLRLEKASDQLRQPNANIEQVAMDCGFVSPNYFIASFYHMYKQTPADFVSQQRSA